MIKKFTCSSSIFSKDGSICMIQNIPYLTDLLLFLYTTSYSKLLLRSFFLRLLVETSAFSFFKIISICFLLDQCRVVVCI